MQLIRKPTKEEEKFLNLLVKKSSIPIVQDWKEDLLVSPMNDGGMGSLLLISNVNEIKRKFGKQVSEYQFRDEDGVDVIASLNIDTDGNLFELDILKTDFSKLIKFPDI